MANYAGTTRGSGGDIVVELSIDQQANVCTGTDPYCRCGAKVTSYVDPARLPAAANNHPFDVGTITNSILNMVVFRDFSGKTGGGCSHQRDGLCRRFPPNGQFSGNIPIRMTRSARLALNRQHCSSVIYEISRNA